MLRGSHERCGCVMHHPCARRSRIHAGAIHGIICPDYATEALITGRKMSKLCYTTPYGLYNGQADASGVWRIVYQMALIDNGPAVAAKPVTNLIRTFSTIDDPLIPKAPRFDPAARQLRWKLPNIPGLSPLLEIEQKPSGDQLIRLIEQLAEQSEKLHTAGLGVFDFSPSLIFATPDLRTTVLVPSMTLASQAVGATGQVERMPYAAPELEHPQKICAAPARADLFGLGALTWFLLTGLERNKHTLKFPSDYSPSFAAWDVFVDGCCRTNPARRFSSIREALESLPAASAAKVPAIKDASGTSKAAPAPAISGVWASLRTKKGQSIAARVCAVIALVVWFSAYLRRDDLAAEHPWIGGFLVSYERGVGDTVLKYENQSYEGREWKKLAAVVDAKINVESLQPSAVFGWDDQNFWILCDGSQGGKSGTAVCRQEDGLWKIDGFVEGLVHPTGCALDREHILLTSRDSAAPLYEFSAKGFIPLGQMTITAESGFTNSAELCVVAPDLVYRLGASPLTKVWTQTEFPDAAVTRLDNLEQQQEALVQGDKTPPPEFPVYRIRFTRASAKGIAFGIAVPAKGTGARFLVRFEEGLWHSLKDELKEFGDAQEAWLTGPASSPSHFVLVGPKGRVVVHEIGGKEYEQQVTAVSTSLHLIAVWGVTIERYWVMDNSGTIWQRSPNRWDVVVSKAGDKVEFTHAWVSRTGTIVAITKTGRAKTDVYRLEWKK